VDQSLPFVSSSAPADTLAYRLYHGRRVAMSLLEEGLLRTAAGVGGLPGGARGAAAPAAAAVPARPEDVDPLARSGLADPYGYYRLLREQRPVYRPRGADFWCVSRYEDVQQLVAQTGVYSSQMVGVMLSKRRGGQAALHPPGDAQGRVRNWGVHPVDVLAVQDAPAHGYQRPLGQGYFTPKFVRGLEAEVRSLAVQLIGDFLPAGRTEFMASTAWRLPMSMAMRLLGMPPADYPRIKEGCAHGTALLSGACTQAEFIGHAAAILSLYRYTWRSYLAARRQGSDNFSGALARSADDPQHPLTHEEAASIVFQVLNAGSDSSASTMGNAVKMLIEHPEVEQRLRAEPAKIADFVDEVLRLESPFQGHFRITRQDVSLHGQHLPRGTRLFLMWASANRDERFWKDPERLDIDRENLRRHVAFGFGPHGCLGRELARMEVRIVLEELLRRTRRIALAGPTPYEAGVFLRTLVELPLAVEPA
jgi:cytochrome P450